MFVDVSKPNRPKGSERNELSEDIKAIMRRMEIKEAMIPQLMNRMTVPDLIKLKEVLLTLYKRQN